MTISPGAPVRAAARVFGVVQGVGFRPFVYRLARARRLSGWVANTEAGAELEVQGESSAVDAFFVELRAQLPPAARIDALEREPRALIVPESEFELRASVARASRRVSIPPDLALCDECRRELANPEDRRFGYAFTNCTACGPRYSIVEALPYDRSRTTMADFPMCAACRAEYEEPTDRRFHAEPIACASCGPSLELRAADGAPLADRRSALARARALLAEGRIVGVRGLGGFQLLVDATNEAAVERLRTRKRRPAKPLAVMFASLDRIEHHLQPSPAERALLCSREGPIVLCRRAPRQPDAETPELAPNLAPDGDELGVMLPTTPLHQLLLTPLEVPVVCTSGNLAEEPQCTELGDAVSRLGHVVDAWLTHDRRITRPIDDSVVRSGAEGTQLIRRARGYAPTIVAHIDGAPDLVALGAHQKNTIALVKDGDVIVSPHLGDLESDAARLHQERTLHDLLSFHGVDPALIACDMHPDYASTRLAQRATKRWGLPLVSVQHHHAHAAAVLAEHAVNEPTLCLIWDGAGLGTDGELWGSEALCWAGGEFTRLERLQSFSLAGGERAAREPRRAALGVCAELGVELPARAQAWFETHERRVLGRMLEQGTNATRTSSVGRLFDAVAALLGVRGVCSYEGQAAIQLEALALAGRTPSALPASIAHLGHYPLPLADQARSDASVDHGTPLAPLLAELLRDVNDGVQPPLIAARFHAALIEWGVAIALAHSLPRVVLSGGCFQNRILLEGLGGRLRALGRDVLVSRQLPPNDAQIALGQAWCALHARASARELDDRIF